MSHYSVMVCLPGETKDINEALEQVLAPFDENLDVEAYRDYEGGSPEEYWWMRSVRREAEHHRNGTGVLPYDPDMLGSSSDRSKFTPDEQRAEFAESARIASAIGEPASWRLVVAAYNEKWHPKNQLAVPGGEAEEFGGLLYDPDSDRAYTMSTRNPQSMWDYWRIGGRWSGYFVAAEALVDIIAPERHWDGPSESRYPGRTACDGGRKSSLDFAAMREAAEAEANQRFDRWLALVDEHGPIKAWSHFRGLVEVGEMGIDEARRRYADQPLVAAERQKRYEDQLGGYECLADEFGTTREEYVRLRKAAVVPAYATVLLNGEWTAPGRMGWFGMSSDGPGEREGYQLAVNQYLEELKPDTWLVVVDCHI